MKMNFGYLFNRKMYIYVGPLVYVICCALWGRVGRRKMAGIIRVNPSSLSLDMIDDFSVVYIAVDVSKNSNDSGVITLHFNY